jgi:hypothetical protein
LGEGWIYGPGFCWELDFLTEGWIFEAGFFGGWIFNVRAGFTERRAQARGRGGRSELWRPSGPKNGPESTGI